MSLLAKLAARGRVWNSSHKAESFDICIDRRPRKMYALLERSALRAAVITVCDANGR
jgi:hypothetical protein